MNMVRGKMSTSGLPLRPPCWVTGQAQPGDRGITLQNSCPLGSVVVLVPGIGCRLGRPYYRLVL